MLGSSHDSERAAAALKATEFLKARNLTWEEFIRQINSGRKPDRRPHWSEGPRTDAEWCRALKEALYQLPVRLGADPLGTSTGDRGCIASQSSAGIPGWSLKTSMAWASLSSNLLSSLLGVSSLALRTEAAFPPTKRGFLSRDRCASCR